MNKIYKMIMNRETFLYLVFGVGTTIVNFLSFAICQSMLGDTYYLISNIISFVCATVFAFVTNKQWVFESKEWKVSVVFRELVTFVSARIASFLIVEELGLFLMVKVLNVDRIQLLSINGILLAKIFLAFTAVIVNYVLSKIYVFKQRGSHD